ncbi:MAG TPA: hypothetical protein VHM30_17265 [Gemmatimonadaceae bacterium]|nr:hypothetical protein [Gemmatimonadaceae bacterium]
MPSPEPRARLVHPDKLSLDGDRLSAELPTSAGIARLTLRLKERSGEGSLVLVSRKKS